MSRAINLTVPHDSVTTACRQLKVGISAIESLPSGGTRVVMDTSEGAEALRVKLKTKIVKGQVTRSPLFPVHRPW